MTNQAVNDLRKVETGFYRNLGDGRKAAQFFATMVHSVVSSRDTTVFTRQMDKIRKEKSDTVAIRAMATIIRAVWPGAKAKYNKATGQHSIVIKGIKADKDALERMNQGIEDNLSLRDTFAKRVQGDVAAAEVDVSEAPKKAKAVMKRFCDKYDITPVAFIAMLTAKETNSPEVVDKTLTPSQIKKATSRSADVVAH